MKFQMHTAIGYDGTPAPTPSPLDTHEAAREFTAALADLFQVEPARVVHDEWRTAPYVWTNVTVCLPVIGTAVFSVDSRKSGAAALRLYLNERPVPVDWTPEGAPGHGGHEGPRGSVGQTLAQAVADYQARQSQDTVKQ
ncbi:hypothetical protein [Streptomyces xanthii]|uniref:Uncharacterized protein n=1 Tax=Streptomyces xanthii TaxID=2768069 RepID=A0A7H1BLA5_9ACTN|nr:hypothetical protein [Streptomyces xanthii]QNS09510.1 hypothetical protein IAG42_37815 [Streptomyces xanthii]